MRPLSEHVTLHLRHGGDTNVQHVLVYAADGDRLAGYAHLDVTDEVSGSSAELVVDPGLRGARARPPPGRRSCSRETPGRPAAALVARRARSRRRAGRLDGLQPCPARCGRCAARCTPRCPSRCCRPAIEVRTFRPGADDDGLAGAQRARVRRAPRAGPLDRGGPASSACRSRGSTPTGSSWPTAGRARPEQMSASTGRRCTAAPPARATHDHARRSARSTSSAWTPPSRAAASAGR